MFSALLAKKMSSFTVNIDLIKGASFAALPVLRFIRKEIAKHVSCKLFAMRVNKISLWIFYLELGMTYFMNKTWYAGWRGNAG